MHTGSLSVSVSVSVCLSGSPPDDTVVLVILNLASEQQINSPSVASPLHPDTVCHFCLGRYLAAWIAKRRTPQIQQQVCASVRIFLFVFSFRCRPPHPSSYIHDHPLPPCSLFWRMCASRIPSSNPTALRHARTHTHSIARLAAGRPSRAGRSSRVPRWPPCWTRPRRPRVRLPLAGSVRVVMVCLVTVRWSPYWT